MFDTALIATAHGIEAAELNKSLADHGWDFSSLDMGNPAALEFVTNVVTSSAEKIAARHAAIAARRAKGEAKRLACMTVEAKANPDRVCGKCDGKGKLDVFRHIEKGTCFWCKGSGVIRPRR